VQVFSRAPMAATVGSPPANNHSQGQPNQGVQQAADKIEPVTGGP